MGKSVVWWFALFLLLVGLINTSPEEDSPESISPLDLFDTQEELDRFVLPFIDIVDANGDVVDVDDEERLFIKPIVGAAVDGIKDGQPINDTVYDIKAGVGATIDVLRFRPKLKLIQCVTSANCPPAFPFCRKVESQDLLDPSTWVEGIRACFQCTDTNTTTCGERTPHCNNGFCTECSTAAHCESADYAPANPVCTSLGQCQQCYYDVPDTTPPFNFYEASACQQVTTQVPTCGPGFSVSPDATDIYNLDVTLDYKNFGNCVQCATTSFNETAPLNNCPSISPFCTDILEDGPTSPICRQCSPDFKSLCSAKSTRTCSATTFTCGGCQNDNDCEESQICVDGQCTKCTPLNTSKCNAANPYCIVPDANNVAASTCGGCRSDADCTVSPQLKCDTVTPTYTCKECVVDADCPANYFCVDGACRQCTNDAQCSPGHGAFNDYCDLTTNTCWPCLNNSPNVCGNGQFCKDKICITGCSASSECPSNAPLCVDEKCTQCTQNSDCIGNENGEVCSPDGFCTQCLQSSQCDANGPNPVCQTTTTTDKGLVGTCVPCTVDSDCGGNTPVCCGNVCRGCCGSADCNSSPLNPVCSIEGFCRPCEVDSECGTAGSQNAFCYTAGGGNNICGECKTNADCSGGTGTCSMGHCLVPTCTTDADCLAKEGGRFPFCDLSVVGGRCIQCETSTDCTNPKTPVCASKNSGDPPTCNACSADADCTGNPGGPYCDTVTGSCVGCLNDAACAGNSQNPVCCDGNVCCPCKTGATTLCDAVGQVCDVPGKVCTACTGNPDCPADLPFCVDGTCRECDTTADCPTTQYCTADKVCLPGCDSDAQCASLYSGEREFCELTSHTCVTCLTDPNCTDNPGTICELTDPARKYTCVDCSPTLGGCTDGVCDPSTFTCLPCIDDGDCAGSDGGPYCSESNICVPCEVNAHCPGSAVCEVDTLTGNNVCVDCLENADCPTGVCDTSTKTCTPCLSGGTGCGGPTPVCVTTSNPHKCVGCTQDSDCTSPTQPFCDTSTNTCTTCLNNSGCTNPRNPVCLTTAAGSTCVQCTQANQQACGNKQVCDDTKKICVSCLTNADCAGNSVNTRCDRDRHTCVPECTSDAQCSGQTPVCKDYKCTPRIETLTSLIGRKTDFIRSEYLCERVLPGLWRAAGGRMGGCQYQKGPRTCRCSRFP